MLAKKSREYNIQNKEVISILQNDWNGRTESWKKSDEDMLLSAFFSTTWQLRSGGLKPNRRVSLGTGAHSHVSQILHSRMKHVDSGMGRSHWTETRFSRR